MALIKCPDCKKEISDTTKKCIHCGSPIEKKLVCKECGEVIEHKSKVCPKCGAKLKNNIFEKISKKTLIIIGSIIGAIVIISVIIALFSNGTSSESNATHERVPLDDYNISNYLTVNLSGRLSDYSSKYYHKAYMSGSITASHVGSQCENVSFKLKMVVKYKTSSWSSSSTSDTFTEYVTLDSGCNYNIAGSHNLTRSANESVGYSYSIEDVTGNVVIPKTVIE